MIGKLDESVFTTYDLSPVVDSGAGVGDATETLREKGAIVYAIEANLSAPTRPQRFASLISQDLSLHLNVRLLFLKSTMKELKSRL